MENGFKRKFDSTMESDVILSYPTGYVEQFHNNKKKMRLSVQVGANSTNIAETGLTQHQPFYNQSYPKNIVEESDRFYQQSYTNRINPNHSLSELDFDCKDSQNNSRDEDLEDIPTTSEVINSLRKVILWMSAQGDHNSDYIQYLSEVERYAVSKQLNLAQQRKITQYLIRHSP